MGYIDYLTQCIVESGLEETDDLLEILESVETIDDAEAIEEYLTEGKKRGPMTRERQRDIKKREKTGTALAPYVRGEVSAREQRKGGALTTRDMLKNLPATRSNGDIIDCTVDDKGFAKVDSQFSSGAIVAGAAALLAIVAATGLKIRSAVKKNKSSKARQIENQIKELEKQAMEISKRCKSGDITAKEARVESKKIQAQIKKLAKEAERAAKDEATVTKESVMIDIYESERSGEITEEETNVLLALLQ